MLNIIRVFSSMLLLMAVTNLASQNMNNECSSDCLNLDLSALYAQDFKNNISLLRSKQVSVLGVLKTIEEDNKVVNIELVPTKYFLNFNNEFGQRFSIHLGGILDDENEILVNKNCFNQFVLITGVADVYGGKPSINNVAFIINMEHSEASNCLKKQQTR